MGSAGQLAMALRSACPVHAPPPPPLLLLAHRCPYLSRSCLGCIVPNACRVRETAKAAKDMGVRHVMNLGHGIMQVCGELAPDFQCGSLIFALHAAM